MLSCSLIVMVENMIVNYVESKLSNVDASVELKWSKVEASVDVKPNIIEAFVDAKPSLVGSVVKSSFVDSSVSKPRDNEVDTTSFFSTKDTWKALYMT